MKISSDSQALTMFAGLNDMSRCYAGPWITRKLPFGRPVWISHLLQARKKAHGLEGNWVVTLELRMTGVENPKELSNRLGKTRKIHENAIFIVIFENIMFLWFAYCFNSTPEAVGSSQPQSCRKNCINSISSKRKLIKAQSCQCRWVQLVVKRGKGQVFKGLENVGNLMEQGMPRCVCHQILVRNVERL